MSRRTCNCRSARRQRGAIVVVVGLSIVVLVLMLGLVLDLGHMYIAKTELQNAADACALSAARELNDLSTGALERATAAGKKVGELNRVGLQQAPVVIDDLDIKFSSTLAETPVRAITPTTTYVHCSPHGTQPLLVPMWFMTLAGIVDWPMYATATARLTAGSSLCAIPVALCTDQPTAPNFGLVQGNWYTGREPVAHGFFGWVEFQKPGGKQLGEMLAGPGLCNIGPEFVDAKHGVDQGVAQAWNTRFGLYSGTWDDIEAYAPDRTGWAYTPDRTVKSGHTTSTLAGSWTAGANAYNDYLGRKNNTHDPFNPGALLADNGKPVPLPGNPSPLSRDLHATVGQDRRMVFVPVIECDAYLPNGKNMRVLDWACGLLLSPVSNPETDVSVEFRGLKSAGACATSGSPGAFGPPVPGLVK